MSLDALGRKAAQTLNAVSADGLDPDIGLARLVRTRRRRSRAKVACGTLTVVAIASIAFLALRPAREDAAPVIPSRPLPSVSAADALTGNGPILVVYKGRPTAVSPVPQMDGPAASLPLPTVGPPLPSGEVAGIPQIADPHWSGDGRHLLFLGGSAVRDLDMATGVERTVATCHVEVARCALDVSTDGRWLVMTQGHSLLLVDVVAGATRTIVEDAGSVLSGPTFSPDATSIAFLATEPPTPEVGDIGEATGVRIVGSDGTGMRRVYGTGGHDTLSGPDAVSFKIKGLDWSPDGQRLAALVWTAILTPSPGGGGSAEDITEWVTTIPVAGGDPTGLFDAGDPCECFITMRASAANGITWSPDGTQVAVVAARGLLVAAAAPGAEPRVVLANEQGPEPAIQMGDGGSYYDTSTWSMASSTPAWRPVP